MRRALKLHPDSVTHDLKHSLDALAECADIKLTSAFGPQYGLYPDYPLWRDFPYEYEEGKLAIDVINGGPLLRE